MGKALAYAIELLTSLPALIDAGVAVGGLLEKGKAKLQEFADQKRDPTAAEWDELNASIDEKRRELHG